MDTKEDNLAWSILMNFFLKVSWRWWWEDSSGRLWGISVGAANEGEKMEGARPTSGIMQCRSFLRRAPIHPNLHPALGCLRYWQFYMARLCQSFKGPSPFLSPNLSSDSGGYPEAAKWVGVEKVGCVIDQGGEQKQRLIIPSPHLATNHVPHLNWG